MISASRVYRLYIHDYNWSNLIIIYLVERLEHWQRRETFDNIKHCLVAVLFPEFDLYGNSLGLLHWKVWFSVIFFFVKESHNVLVLTDKCFYVSFGIWVLWR